jgi:hypothetical protein
MFQWSANRRRTDSGSGTGAYPAMRAVMAASSIQGSIRPPAGATREQHLDSYLNDATLKRSTRRIPPGKVKDCGLACAAPVYAKGSRDVSRDYILLYLY